MKKEGGTYNSVILHFINFSPSCHDPSVIRGNHSNDIDTLLAEFSCLADEWWNVIGLAGWSEGTYTEEIPLLEQGHTRTMVDRSLARNFALAYLER